MPERKPKQDDIKSALNLILTKPETEKKEEKVKKNVKKEKKIRKKSKKSDTSDTPLYQHTGISDKLVKETFYLTEDTSKMLEEIFISRYKKKKKGERVNKSALIREAIILLAKKEGLVK